ncbi:unnamed protein product [Effrenium voratum]|nr:unnamed protein product [Effrenium voratum]
MATGKLGFTLLDFDEESVSPAQLSALPGFGFPSPEHQFVWVDQVLEMGTVPEWNEQNPLAKVATGTRILEVNGIKGDVNKIYEELKKKSSVLELLVESHGPETANPKEPAAEGWFSTAPKPLVKIGL